MSSGLALPWSSRLSRPRLTAAPAHRHIISVPPGAHLLSDAIASSPILAAEGGAAPPVGADGFQEFPEAMAGGGGGGEGGGGGAGGDFGGIDPNMDPELAMVRRVVWLRGGVVGADA